MNRRLTLAVLTIFAAAACSRQPDLADPVARGRRDFEGLGCVKCHQLGDQGHAWGPNLTLVGFRKSPAWLDQWLKNPHGWNVKTIMPNFDLTDGQRGDLVAFLSAQKGQAWSVYPWRTPQAKTLPPVERGRLIFNMAGCVACHGRDGVGGYPNNNVAGGLIPSLTLVSDGYSKDELHSKIQNGSTPLPDDPNAPAPLIRMPKWGDQLKPDEIDDLVAYLFSLHPKTAAGDSSGF
ncbi:MAG: c-type cytochrome [Elusimicrobia bacterium]|nr:c-type cytochrome [Elusimicrobiota bacterium]